MIGDKYRVHDAYGYICDAGSEFTKENLERM